MSSLFDNFETSLEKENKGAEVTFAPNEDGTVPTFIIAATSRTNQKYARELNRAVKPWRKNLDAMGDEKAQEVMFDVFIKTILKGWSNVQDKDGTLISYSEANARSLLTRLPRLYDALVEKANEIEIFREAQREEDAKN